jgi:phage gp36-like protein
MPARPFRFNNFSFEKVPYKKKNETSHFFVVTVIFMEKSMTEASTLVDNYLNGRYQRSSSKPSGQEEVKNMVD